MSVRSLASRHGKRLVTFLSVGAIGSIINLGVLSLAFGVARVPYAIATAIALECAILFNFVGHYHVTFRDRKGSIARKFFSFHAVSLVAATVAWLVMNGLALAFGTGAWWVADAWSLVGIGFGFLVNYSLNVSLTWRSAAAHATQDVEDPR